MWPDSDSNSAKLYARAKQVEPGGINRLQTWQEPFPERIDIILPAAGVSDLDFVAVKVGDVSLD